jgi:DNA gyrase/topoisomerase IV subunit A
MYASGVYAGIDEEIADVEKKVKQVRKEIHEIQKERTRVKNDLAEDKKEFKQYRTRISKRIRAMRHEIDSIQNEVHRFEVRKDSLSGEVTSIKASQQQYDLRQDYYRRALLSGVDALKQQVQMLPPGAVEKIMSSVDILRNELATTSVDNVEATTRFFQIAENIGNAGGHVQVVQGSSPVASIRGTSYRIQIGSFYEAVVNAQGNKAAVWLGEFEDGEPVWNEIQESAVASRILKAVNVREGKAIPSLVSVPMPGAPIEQKKTKEQQ